VSAIGRGPTPLSTRGAERLRMTGGFGASEGALLPADVGGKPQRVPSGRGARAVMASTDVFGGSFRPKTLEQGLRGANTSSGPSGGRSESGVCRDGIDHAAERRATNPTITTAVATPRSAVGPRTSSCSVGACPRGGDPCCFRVRAPKCGWYQLSGHDRERTPAWLKPGHRQDSGEEPGRLASDTNLQREHDVARWRVLR
jgi:hypothetical protein